MWALTLRWLGIGLLSVGSLIVGNPASAEPLEPVPEDPLAGEGPAEPPPEVDVTVPPPPDGYRNQNPFAPKGVLWSSVAAAERKLADADQAMVDQIALVRAQRLRLKRLDAQRAEIDLGSTVTTQDLLAATDRLVGRAVLGFQLFVADNEASANKTMPGDQDPAAKVNNAMRRSHLVAAALDADEADAARLESLSEALGQQQRAILERRELVVEQMETSTQAARDAIVASRQAEAEYLAFKAGSEVFISSVVFPIAGPFDPFIDSFGFPRMTGTPDEHWHEGIDLFAPRGTPLVAAERGVIARLGSGRLGGLKFWLIGESGSEWYYAHLDSFAPGLREGAVVEAGDLVGYVGNTGNAVGTPPHLHLQLHPNGGRPVNPYPLLSVIASQEAEQRAAGDPSVAWVHEASEPN